MRMWPESENMLRMHAGWVFTIWINRTDVWMNLCDSSLSSSWLYHCPNQQPLFSLGIIRTSWLHFAMFDHFLFLELTPPWFPWHLTLLVLRTSLTVPFGLLPAPPFLLHPLSLGISTILVSILPLCWGLPSLYLQVTFSTELQNEVANHMRAPYTRCPSGIYNTCSKLNSIIAR